MATSPRSNRGPGAATENRAALIAAAREIFAAEGIHAPLSSVAKAAGVGQGSLYRHFPTRYSLALAVFEENVDDLERVASPPEATLGDVLRAITEQAIVSTAFFEMMEVDRTDDASENLAERVDSVLASKIDQARAAGQLADWVTADDLRLSVAMLVGALAKTTHDDRGAVAARIWTLLPFGPSER
jgi:AcrR family transcriptional regulator